MNNMKNNVSSFDGFAFQVVRDMHNSLNTKTRNTSPCENLRSLKKANKRVMKKAAHSFAAQSYELVM